MVWKRPEGLNIGLALSGGGARCAAHIGVLEVLHEEGIQIGMMAGTSGGSLVGCLYAAGVDLGTIKESLSQLKWMRMAKLDFSKMGFLSSARIEDLIKRFTRKRQFFELNIPLALVATKLMTGQSVVLKKGSILEAVRASCSIPELFAPVRVGKDLLVDGGIADNLPVGVVGEMGADLVVAVDCSPEVEPAEPKNLFQVAHRLAFLLGRAKIEQSRREADVLISPEVGHVDSMDYAHSRELISIGRIAAQRAIPQLRQEIAKRRGFFYRLRRGIGAG